MNIKLKLKLVAQNIRIGKLATEVGISKSALYRKLKGDHTFNRDEILKIVKFLKLTDQEILNIFFAERVS